MTKTQLDELAYDELLGWMEYFRRRPIGWRADNRAAIITMSSMGGGKLKPEDLFDSLRVIKKETTIQEDQAPFAAKFFDRFKNRMSEQEVINDNFQSNH